MMYKNRTVKEMDSCYGINDGMRPATYKINDSKKIQQAFLENNLELTLTECKSLYEAYSDEKWCAGWENGIEDTSHENIFKMLLPFLIDMVNDRISRISQISEQLIKNDYVNIEKEPEE